MQKPFEQLLLSFGAKYSNLVALASDSVFNDLVREFSSMSPGRQWNFGLSHKDLVDTAAGMTVPGKLPVVCATERELFGNARENIQHVVCAPNLNVKLFGVTDWSNFSIIEADFMNLRIFQPKDKDELKTMMQEMLESYGPAYMRIFP